MELMVLVRKAQAGDEQAVGEICERFTGLVKKYAYQPRMKTIVEDALSQGWLEVVQGIRQYDEKSGIQFAGYMEARVKYGIWNLFKWQRFRWEKETQLDGGQDDDGLSRLEQLADNLDVPREVEEKWLAQELMAAVTVLSDRQQRAIIRTVLDCESLKVVSAELGITPQGVYNLRQRGFASLKKTCSGMYKDIRQ